MGLATTRRRLAAMYDGAHRFDLVSRAAGGLEVRVTIPWRVRGADA